MDDFDQAMNWFLKSAWLACQPKPWQRLVEVAGVEADRRIANILTMFHYLILNNTLRIFRSASRCPQMQDFEVKSATFLQLITYHRMVI